MENGVYSREYSVTHEEFIEAMTEVIAIVKDRLEIFKKAYRLTKDPFCKSEIETYAGVYVELIELFKKYTLRVENGIEVQPIVVFDGCKAMFGYREKKDLEFSKKWYERIVFKGNGEQAGVS